MSSGIFQQIIEGKIPSYKIFEDDLTYSFLSNRPVKKGHILVIPKIEVDYFCDVPEPYYSQVFKNAKFLSQALKKATDCLRVSTAILGYEIPHFHYHLIPSWDLSDLDFSKAKEDSVENFLDMQKKIISCLEEF